MKTFRLAYVLTALLLLGVLLLGANELLTSWEMDSLALRQRLDSLPPRDRSDKVPITLVGYDYKSFGSETFNRLFGNPISGRISRLAPAYAIRFFKRANPKAVVFDISFNGGNNYADLIGDKALIDSLQGTQSFASAIYFDQQTDGGRGLAQQPPVIQKALKQKAITVTGLSSFPKLSSFRYRGLVPPYEGLLTQTPMNFYAAQGSFSNPEVTTGKGSSNSYNSFWSPFANYGGYVFPSMPLGAILGKQQSLKLDSTGQLTWPGGCVDLGASGFPVIRWHGHGVDKERPVYPEFSFWDVIQSEIALSCQENPKAQFCQEADVPKTPRLQPKDFDGRYVIIGFTMPDRTDVHKTIYGIRYNGVYILANVLDNLLSNDLIHPAPMWMNALSVLLLSGLMMISILRFRNVWLNALIVLSLVLGYFLLTLWVYQHNSLWLNVVYPTLAILGCFTVMYVIRYYREYQQRQQLRLAFGKYVSPAVMSLIEAHPEKLALGGERREMTFLFCDIRGFTKYSDQESPEVVQSMLTRYFSLMNGIILKQYGGTINKLIGDAIMAYWGFPLDHEDHAKLAVSAALAMRDAMEAWRADPANPPLSIGIGINTGEAVIGNVGSEDFMDFTVIGDAVNVASRLESLNKEHKTTILISEAAYERLAGKLNARAIGALPIRGKDQEVKVFEPLNWL